MKKTRLWWNIHFLEHTGTNGENELFLPESMGNCSVSLWPNFTCTLGLSPLNPSCVSKDSAEHSDFIFFHKFIIFVQVVYWDTFWIFFSKMIVSLTVNECFEKWCCFQFEVCHGLTTSWDDQDFCWAQWRRTLTTVKIVSLNLKSIPSIL